MSLFEQKRKQAGKMNNKLLLIILLASIFTVFATVVYAKNSNLLCSKKQKLIVTLKNEAIVNKSRDKILEIPHIKIIKTTYRDKEWSKMVNKMDLPKMENPFKNEFLIKINKKGNADEIYNKINNMDFVESVKFVSNPECAEKQK